MTDPTETEDLEFEATKSRRRLGPVVLAALVAIVGAHVVLDARDQKALRQQVQEQQAQIEELQDQIQQIQALSDDLNRLSEQLLDLYDAFNSYQAEAKAVLTKVSRTLSKVSGKQTKEIQALRERIDGLLEAGRLADNELKEVVRELESLHIKLSETQDELRTTKRDNFEVNATRASRLLNTHLWELTRFQRCARRAVQKSGIDEALVNVDVVTDRTVETLLQVRYTGGESMELELGSPMAKSLSSCVSTVLKAPVADEDLPEGARTYHLVRKIEAKRGGVQAGGGNR